MINATDETYLAMTMTLAARGRGKTNPNPLVGAVVVRQKKVVATGYHHRCGGPHAEILALRKAGELARGATLYINLEPCDHIGRTPACTHAILKAGLARVVIGMKDPNPITNGRGIRRLKEGGIQVDCSRTPEKFRQINRVFSHFITTKSPYVVVKTGQSLDGKLATHRGDSRWVTGDVARRRVHKLRLQADAIVVGINTLMTDDPLLSCRLGGRIRRDKPVKVILDEKLRTPLTARIFSRESPAPVILATTRHVSGERIRRYERHGIMVLRLRRQPNGYISITHLMQELTQRGMACVLVEGGGEVIGSFFDAQLVNEVYCFIAPKIIGGRNAVAAVAGRGYPAMSGTALLEGMSVMPCGNDFLAHAQVVYPAEKEKIVRRGRKTCLPA